MSLDPPAAVYFRTQEALCFALLFAPQSPKCCGLCAPIDSMSPDFARRRRCGSGRSCQMCSHPGSTRPPRFSNRDHAASDVTGHNVQVRMSSKSLGSSIGISFPSYQNSLTPWLCVFALDLTPFPYCAARSIFFVSQSISTLRDLWNKATLLGSFAHRSAARADLGWEKTNERYDRYAASSEESRR